MLDAGERNVAVTASLQYGVMRQHEIQTVRRTLWRAACGCARRCRSKKLLMMRPLPMRSQINRACVGARERARTITHANRRFDSVGPISNGRSTKKASTIRNVFHDG